MVTFIALGSDAALVSRPASAGLSSFGPLADRKSRGGEVGAAWHAGATVDTDAKIHLGRQAISGWLQQFTPAQSPFRPILQVLLTWSHQTTSDSFFDKVIALQAHPALSVEVVASQAIQILVEEALSARTSFRESMETVLGQKEVMDRILQHAGQQAEAARSAAQAAEVSAGRSADAFYGVTLLAARDQHSSTAKRLLAAVTALCTVWAFVAAAFASTLYHAVHVYGDRWLVPVLGRGLVLTSLAGVIVWVMRLHRAERHNAIAYNQKLAALNTFESFAAATNRDSAAKSAVIAHAMATIFASHDSGYAGTGSESAMPSEAVVNAISSGVDRRRKSNRSDG